MTTVTAKAEKGRYFIKCEGHADTEDVCTAISTLCCSLELWCANTDSVKYEVEKEPGHFKISFWNHRDCEVAFHFTLWALTALQHDHSGIKVLPGRSPKK